MNIKHMAREDMACLIDAFDRENKELKRQIKHLARSTAELLARAEEAEQKLQAEWSM